MIFSLYYIHIYIHKHKEKSSPNSWYLSKVPASPNFWTKLINVCEVSESRILCILCHLDLVFCTQISIHRCTFIYRNTERIFHWRIKCKVKCVKSPDPTLHFLLAFHFCFFSSFSLSLSIRFILMLYILNLNQTVRT